MRDEYDKPETTMDQLFDCYQTMDQPITENTQQQPKRVVVEAVEPETLGLLHEVTNLRQGLRKSVKGIKTAPKSAQSALFESYKAVDKALLNLEREIQILQD